MPCTLAAPRIGPGGTSSCAGWRMNGRVCSAAEAAVEADQLLERAALVELGVVEAAHHDVADVLEAVGAQEVLGRGGRERGERVLALDAAVREVVGAAGAEGDRPVLGRVNQQPADVRVLAERGQEPRVPLLDLLERQAAGLLHQVDEPEVAGAEHDDVAVARRHSSAASPASRSPRRRRARPSSSARRRRRSRTRRPSRASARRARRGRSRCVA